MATLSDIRIKICKKGFEEIKKLLNDEYYKDLRSLDYCVELRDESRSMVFGWRNICWSEEDKRIIGIINVLNSLDISKGEYYKLIQIRDDNYDVEQTNELLSARYTGDFYITKGFSL